MKICDYLPDETIFRHAIFITHFISLHIALHFNASPSWFLLELLKCVLGYKSNWGSDTVKRIIHQKCEKVVCLKQQNNIRHSSV